MFAGYTTYEKHREKWICTYENGHMRSLSQWPMSTNWNEVSNSLVSFITWRNSDNIRICKGEKYAISWQNHEDHFFNKYRLPTKSFVCLFVSFSPILPLFFLPSCALKDRNWTTEKNCYYKAPSIRLIQFFAFFEPLGHLCSRDTSIQGTLNLVPENSSHNICNCYL